jgi:DNA-binding XRE family transcriptional regulator
MSSVRVFRLDPGRERPVPLAGLRRTRPRAYEEWKALRAWNRLPANERLRPGYLLRLARESSGLTQTQLARRLGLSQQAVAQAERWESNPTLRLLEEWAAALDARVELAILRENEEPRAAGRR